MLIYVSGKYSGKNDREVTANIALAQSYAVALWELGHAVICPHLNTAHFEKVCNATYEQYIAGDLVMIARCDAMVMLPNWGESKGAKIEREYAEQLGIPVFVIGVDVLPDVHPTERRCPQQARAFAEVCGQMYRTHLSKNSDYSPANILATGEVGLVTRLWDKIARLMNLTGFRIEISDSTFDAPRTPKHESIDDTLMDAAVYAIIGLLLRRKVWGK